MAAASSFDDASDEFLSLLLDKTVVFTALLSPRGIIVQYRDCLNYTP